MSDPYTLHTLDNGLQIVIEQMADVRKAMAELAQARKLFARGGNRRAEAMTLHLIPHAALDEDDLEL